jgi:hypothetical protein
MNSRDPYSLAGYSVETVTPGAGQNYTGGATWAPGFPTLVSGRFGLAGPGDVAASRSEQALFTRGERLLRLLREVVSAAPQCGVARGQVQRVVRARQEALSNFFDEDPDARRFAKGVYAMTAERALSAAKMCLVNDAARWIGPGGEATVPAAIIANNLLQPNIAAIRLTLWNKIQSELSSR